MNKQEEQVLLGLILGDGCLQKINNTKLSYAHGLKQLDYALWKKSALPSLKLRHYFREQVHNKTNKTYKNVTIQSRVDPKLNYYYDLFYTRGIKVLSSIGVSLLAPLGLAVWFMDDGTKGTSGGYYLCTNGFTVEDVRRACIVLRDKFGFNCNHILSSKGQPLIYIPKRGGAAKVFTDIVRDYIHPSMLYKLHSEPELLERKPNDKGQRIIVNKNGIFYKKYRNIKEAAIDLNLDRECIDSVLKGTRKRQSYKTKQYTFFYENNI